MSRRYSQKERSFAGANESDSMMKDEALQLKFLQRGIGNQFHLVLGHFRVRFVIDSLNLAIVLQLPDHAPEIDDCS